MLRPTRGRLCPAGALELSFHNLSAAELTETRRAFGDSLKRRRLRLGVAAEHVARLSPQSLTA